MAEANVAAIPQQQQAARVSMGPFETLIEGKVDAIDQPNESEWQYFTILAKAADEYSSPQSVQISQLANQRPFARVGDIVRVKVRAGGYVRRHNGNRYVTNTLTLVEAL